jgi:hypothetical protein
MLESALLGRLTHISQHGYREMRNKVTLVARNMERTEKIRLQKEIKQAVGMAGVGEVESTLQGRQGAR